MLEFYQINIFTGKLRIYQIHQSCPKRKDNFYKPRVMIIYNSCFIQIKLIYQHHCVKVAGAANVSVVLN